MATSGNIWLCVAVVDRITIAAISLTVLGWALIWACALSLIEFVPPEAMEWLRVHTQSPNPALVRPAEPVTVGFLPPTPVGLRPRCRTQISRR